MWSDGVFVHGKANNFQKCWYCGLPEYILFEILRSFKAKVLIAQVQMAPGCQSCLELYFEGGPDEVPKFVEVKIVIYTNYKIENPTNFLANFFRKWWKPSGEYRDFCSIKELLAPDPDEETNPDGEFDPSWETLRQIEMMVERQKTPLEE